MRDTRTTVSSCAVSRTSIPWGPHRRLHYRRAIQTLSDVEYQEMRDDAFAVLRRVGVETGGSNVQFAVDPPRASDSSSR